MRAPQNTALRWASISLAFIAPLASPSDLTIPNTFVSGTPATAATVNENFTATATAVNSKQDRIVGTCPGQAIAAVNANGTVVCQPLTFFGGDGSAGDLTVAASLDWSSTPPANPNFANVTINAGQTLTVPAGTTIRCSGTFTNNGTLTVLTGARLGAQFLFPVIASEAIYSIGHPGDAFRPASGGAYDNNAAAVTKVIAGGTGGDGIPVATARTSFNAFRIGGGSGAGLRASDGDGGGLVKVYCAGNVVNAGTINAVGLTSVNTSGGGGGGIVILASTSSVANSGTINANGGDGGAAFNSTFLFVESGGAGGGGGGGIVVFVAPSINSGSGIANVAGGQGGSTAVTITTANRYGGGGGGASGGNGGDGGFIPAAASATPNAATSGAAGYVQQIAANPAYLMH